MNSDLLAKRRNADECIKKIDRIKQLNNLLQHIKTTSSLNISCGQIKVNFHRPNLIFKIVIDNLSNQVAEMSNEILEIKESAEEKEAEAAGLFNH